MGIPSQHFRSIIDSMDSDFAIDFLKLPPDLQTLIESITKTSAFVIERLPTLSVYSKGSSAGTPLADVLFLLIMAKILRNIRNNLKLSLIHI